MAWCKYSELHNKVASIEQRVYQKQEDRFLTKHIRASSLASLLSHPFAAKEARQAFEDLLKILPAVSVVSIVGLNKIYLVFHTHLCKFCSVLCADKVELSNTVL